MEWRRKLAAVEEAYDVQLSPYEKSPHFWRQARGAWWAGEGGRASGPVHGAYMSACGREGPTSGVRRVARGGRVRVHAGGRARVGGLAGGLVHVACMSACGREGAGGWRTGSSPCTEGGGGEGV
jgi:hypothetical protein